MLSIDSISHHYDRQQALDDVSFRCVSGAITCLIGPSGCGKTTLLRLVAGLLDVQSGSIALEDDLLSSVGKSTAPENRPIGMVFQEGALFPHLTVARNVGFGLPKNDRESHVAALLDQVGMRAFSDRYPDTLSGGQRQRVALARALAPQPKVLLFDEPYANLDSQRRRSLRDDARRMIRENDLVGVFVTHDPDEVMAIADYVVVLDDGRVVQQGEPQALFDQPKSLRVAELFGDAQSVGATLDADRLHTPFGTWSRACLLNVDTATSDVTAVLRSHAFSIREASEDGLVVEDIRSTGRTEQLLVTARNGDRLRLQRDRGAAPVLEAGSRVTIAPEDSSVFVAAAEVANKNDSH